MLQSKPVAIEATKMDGKLNVSFLTLMSAPISVGLKPLAAAMAMAVKKTATRAAATFVVMLLLQSWMKVAGGLT